MGTAKITKRTVDAAKKGARDAFIWDSELRGFGLKVTPAGRKVYVLQYRFLGRPRRYTIGQPSGTLTPEEARKRADRLLAQVADGIDPAEKKKSLRTDLTVSELADVYLRDGRSTAKASTVAADRRILEHHVKPLLGARKATTITKADIERAHRDVAAGKTARDVKLGPRRRAIVRGGKIVANRMVDTLGAMFEFARSDRLRDDNPARGVTDYTPVKRERFLTTREIGALGDALVAAEARGENPSAINALRLLLLTGCRKNEILTLKWEHIDAERQCLNLPDSKTGAKSVPVGAPVLKLLSSLPRLAGNPFVLPGAKPKSHYVGLQKYWETLRKRCGLEGVRLHDKRHSFASMAVASGESLFMIGKVLGHANASMTERYAHLADDPVRAAADRISGRIAASLDTSAADEAKGRVTELPKLKA